MTKKTKVLLGLTTLVLATSSIIIPISMTVSKKNNYDNNLYIYNGNTFNSKNELFNYAREQADTQIFNLEDNNSWTITKNNKIEYLNSPREAIDFANSRITKFNGKHSQKLQTTPNNELYSSDYQKIYINDTQEIIKVYRGKNNQTFKTEQEAKDSYFSIHDAYYFDGIYFRNKEELRQYIEQNIEKYKTSFSNDDIFVIKGPDNSFSRPINKNDLSKKEIKDYIDEFVDNNKIKYLEVIDKNNQYNYFNKEDLHKNEANVLNTISNYSYVQLDTNDGKANYLVDLHKDDQYELYGPYYTKSSGSITKMQDRSLWRPIEDVDFKFVDNALEAEVISNFLNSVVVDDTVSNDELAKKYPFLILELQEEQKLYFDNLQKNYPSLYERMMNLVIQMRNGKKYNNFYKIPIIFVNLIEELVIQQAKPNIIDQTRKIFNNIAIKYDEFIRSTIPKELLEHARNPDVTFSVVELFGFYKNNFNLNVDIETYIDIIIQEYPDFYSAINFTSNLNAATSRIGNIIDISLEVYQKLFSNKLNTSKWPAYKLIWQCINANSENELMNHVMKIMDSNRLMATKTLAKSFLFAQNLVLSLNGKYNFVAKIKRDLNIVGNDAENIISKLTTTTVNHIKRIFSITNDVNEQYKMIIESIFSANFGIVNPVEINTLILENKITMHTMQMLSERIMLVSFISYTLMEMTVKLVYNTILNPFFQKVKKIVDFAVDFVDKLGKVLETVGKISKLVSMLSAACPYIAIASAVIDLLLNLYKVEKNAYVFESEDAKYVWNGGKTEKYFFGIFSKEISSIKDMKLIGPIKVNQQHALNEYYYNGKRYGDLVDLKKDQINDILNGRYENDKIKNVVSFEKVPSLNINRPKEIFENLGTLNDDKETDLVDNVLENIKSKQKYYQGNIYEYGGGYTFDSNLSNNANIDKIIEKIKPSKIVVLPTLENNYPIFRNDKEEDLSVPEYKLPYTSWTPQTGIIVNNSNTKYLVWDPNKNQNTTLKNDFEQFKQEFYNYFEVQTKEIISNEFHTKEIFSEYSNNIINSIFYYAKNEEGYFKLFIDKASAIEWILNEYNFKAHIKINQKIYYKIDDKVFETLDKYLEYVFSKTIITKR